MSNKNTLVLGLGNDILSDDGIGPRLISDLSRMFNKQDIKFDTACCGGLEILELITGYRKVIFIDAIRTGDGRPGDVYYFLPSEFRETLHLSNLHDINFLTALSLGNALNLGLPAELHIIAIEIVEDIQFGEEFTSPIKEKYPAILEEVHSIICQETA